MTLLWCLNIIPKTINEGINKLDFIKTKMSALKNTMSRELEDKPQTGRKYLQKIHLIKHCYLRYKNSKTQQDETKTLTDTSPGRCRWQGRMRKDASHHLLSGECKLKQQRDVTTFLIERPKSRTSTPPNNCEDMNTAGGRTIHCWGNIKQYCHFGR